MRYQKIHTQIWHDEKFLILSEDGRTLFFYILTCPHGNAVGVFVLPKQYAYSDLRWDHKRFAEPFAELLREGLILYDESTRLVCIVNHLKHNPLENENQSKAAAKIISSLPKSSLYSIIIEQLNKPFHKPLLEQLHERYGEPGTGTGTGTGTELTTLSGKPKSLLDIFPASDPEKQDAYKTTLEKYWTEFPHRNGMKTGSKPATEANMRKYVNLGELQLLLDAVANFKKSQDVKAGIGIPDPERFVYSAKKKCEPWRSWIEIKREVVV